MKECVAHGVTLRLGQNATENTRLVEGASADHVWVHLEKFPSGHVVIESSNPNANVLTDAAAFCLHHTRYRYLQNVGVSVTRVGNLKNTGGGEVEFRSSRRVTRLQINGVKRVSAM